MIQTRIILTAVMGLCAMSLGCKDLTGQSVSFEGTGADPDTQVEVEPGQQQRQGDVICDPFDDDLAGVGGRQGVEASLHYLRRGEPTYSSVSDYFVHGEPVNDVRLYFSQLNVPTRPFDRGFTTQAGDTIQTPEGDTLYEYFALKFKGNIQLSDSDRAGRYQLAILSDDGSILRMKPGQGWETVVNNDGQHPTRMGCATEPVVMNHGNAVPFELDYYQGPRHHIALMLMWRPWPTDRGDVDDPLCGEQGNSLYFDSTKDPSVPQSAYKDLLARGWRVLQPDNFVLPGQVSKNPCFEGNPKIFENQVTVQEVSAVIEWHTDRISTSEVLVVHAQTGAEVARIKDKDLSVSHSIRVEGLRPGTGYRAIAISTSQAGRSAESPVMDFRTLVLQ